MSQPADDHGFDRLKTLLAERGFTIERSEYHRKNFGSWLIVVASRPRILIVWDGKEPWLLYNRRSPPILLRYSSRPAGVKSGSSARARTKARMKIA